MNGGDPSVTSATIPGHPNAVFILSKETSSALLECYEGTIKSATVNATFNLFLSRAINRYGAIIRIEGKNDVSNADGTIVNNVLIDSKDKKPVATLSNDEISGSFIGGDGKPYTVKAKRTL